MTLPADIAPRCAGILGGAEHFAYYGQRVEQCRDCARRHIGGLDRIVWMVVPKFVDGKCPKKIPTEGAENG